MECGTSDFVYLVVFAVLVFLGLCCLYRTAITADRAMQKELDILIGIVTSQLVPAMQILGVFGLLLVGWPGPFATVLTVGGLLNLNMDMWSVRCVADTSALNSYVGSALMFLCLPVATLCIHGLFVLIFRGGRFRDHRSTLISACGTVCTTVFVSVSATVVAPFQCEAHPNGYSTMKMYPQVVCWSSDFGGEHMTFVLVGLFGSCFVAGFVALCVWVVMALPWSVRAGNTAFLHKFAFLFFPFRARAHWYVLVPLFRNLAVALALTVTEPSSQLFFVVMALASCIVLCAAISPWRVRVANVLDVGGSLCFVHLLLLAAIITNNSDQVRVGNMMMAMFLVFALVFLCGGLHIFYHMTTQRGKAFQFFVCQHKQGTAAFARLLKMCLCRDDRVSRVFLDFDDDPLLHFGLVSSQTNIFVVLCTSEIMAKLRAMGQMTVARLHDVDTILVNFPEFAWPCDEFFSNCGMHAEEAAFLTKHGISEKMLQETLLWLRSRMMLYLPQRLSLAAVTTVACKLQGLAPRGFCLGQ